jgi:hypothetical protein
MLQHWLPLVAPLAPVATSTPTAAAAATAMPVLFVVSSIAVTLLMRAGRRDGLTFILGFGLIDQFA